MIRVTLGSSANAHLELGEVDLRPGRRAAFEAHGAGGGRGSRSV
jgi:hypothetical protein